MALILKLTFSATFSNEILILRPKASAMMLRGFSKKDSIPLLTTESLKMKI